jgi:hypothetical protein
MKANSSLSRAPIVRNYDARLPAHWKLKRLLDGSVLVTSKPTLSEKIIFAPFCIGIGAFMTYHAVAIARDIPLLAIIGALIFGGIGFGGLHLLFRREVWKISQNLLIIQRSSLWPYHSSRYTDANLVLTKKKLEHGEGWELKVVAGKQEQWLFIRHYYYGFEYNLSACCPPEFTELGSFLHEYTGWPLVLPKEEAE